MTLTSLAFLALYAWLFLAFFRAGFWRCGERLGDAPAPAAWPAVVAIIPARDEAETIGRVIAGHQASDYPGRFSLIVIDDASADATAALARAAAENGARDTTVITAPPLEAGWTGKLAAQRAGLAFAADAEPNAAYVLLCDADIAFAPGTLRRLVALAEARRLALVSLMARLDARGAGALLIPAFVFFFQKLYPFPLVNDPSSTVAAAAGGCMLARRDALAAAGGLEAIRTRLIDDCALAGRMKHRGAGAPRPIRLMLADREVESLRDNRSLSSVWNMVARTAYAQLDHSPLLLAGALAGMGVVYLAPPLIALLLPLHGSWTAAGAALAAWTVSAATYRPTLALYGRPVHEAALLPIAGALYAAMTFASALRHWRGAGGRWKGRVYP